MSGKTPVIIPRIDEAEHTPAWQSELANAVRSTEELLQLLGIEAGPAIIAPRVDGFPLRVPRGFVRRMQAGNAQDPLLLQVLPVLAETATAAGYQQDPLAETSAMPVPGLLHKYRGRALLTVTGACAVHCRYCFRRHFPYHDANPAGDQWVNAVRYLDAHTDIHELILSGGDPLSLTDRRLAQLSRQLDKIAHLHTLRIHTRTPVVLPERVDSGLLEWIANRPQRVVMVIHCNHPNEIDDHVMIAMRQLAQADVTLLNQSVLLKAVNDDTDTLVRLSERLFAAGVLPYYLHQLDRVQGAAHFEVDDLRARSLHADMRSRLPGYLVPRLVREEPGATGKTLLV